MKGQVILVEDLSFQSKSSFSLFVCRSVWIPWLSHSVPSSSESKRDIKVRKRVIGAALWV